jgi:hypothetical protein
MPDTRKRIRTNGHRSPEPNSAHKRKGFRLTLPVSVACDLEKFEQALANVARQLGCSSRSAFDAKLCPVRDFVVDSASLQVTEAAGEL